MKKILLISSLLVNVIAYTPAVQAEDNLSLRVCEYIAVNDKKRLRSFLKTRKLKIRSIFKSIQCNGQNLLIFAASSNALDTGELIINKLPKQTVEENLAEIEAKSAHLANAAKKRID